MSARTEPSVGIFEGIFGTKQSVKSHEVVLADALQAFTEAHAGLIKASSTIEAQIAEHEAQAAEHTAKAAEATESLSRLQRVRSRITDLIA
ncbi:hypothetical protein uav_063 [Pseudomonas phage UAVern]|uniref:Uncharacterized protein n=1 Tax=Pseudomonas phage UAVern TaxID=2856997 RepID=A0A975UUF5_9CAUD|nr:hypothetical protein uav_063 [Pseudomonas phage UAVern]